VTPRPRPTRLGGRQPALLALHGCGGLYRRDGVHSGGDPVARELALRELDLFLQRVFN